MTTPPLSDEPVEFVVKARMAGRRIDAYLAGRYPDHSRSALRKAIEAGAVLINGRPVKASFKVREGDVLRARLPELLDCAPPPEDIPLDVLYEDEAFVVVNKPPGMVVHPAKGHWGGTLVNALQFRFDRLSGVNGAQRPGIVHRLDRDTSGLILVAKEDRAHAGLACQFEERTIEKSYQAIVSGEPPADSDYVEKPIGPHPHHREKMAIRRLDDGAREALTYYEVVERFRGHARVRCKPFTGRTHQIRIHLTHVGLPILADKLYSGRDRFTRADLTGKAEDAADVLLDRQALHAHTLRLTHPLTGREMTFEAPLPPDFVRALDALRASGP